MSRTARSTTTLLVLGVCLALATGLTATAQTDPFLSHGNLTTNGVTLTLKTPRDAHVMLFWGFAEGPTAFDLPANLGGRVELGLQPALLFASTLDGFIAPDPDGEWSYRLVPPPLLQGLIRDIYFQAVAFRSKRSRLAASVSNLLRIDLTAVNEPRSKLQQALQILRRERSRVRNGRPLSRFGFGRPSIILGRRLETHQGAYQFDPFGNRMFRPRILRR